MQNFYLEYNPYKNTSIFKLNSTELTGTKFDTYKQNYRLQQYLEARDIWPGLFAAIIECAGGDEVQLEFHGREIDYNDLKEALSESPESNKINLQPLLVAKNDSDMIDSIGEIMESLQTMNIDEVKDNPKILEAYRIAKNMQLKVSVIATMSSGKSTLINSFLGTELLPNKNEACTATVARILNNEDLDSFEVECRNVNEEIVVPRKPMTRADIEGFNDQGKDLSNDDPSKIIYIDMEGPIPAINSDKIRLLLQDTPGPNNSQDRKHRDLTERMIKDKKNSVILYVMNATQLRVEDDERLLRMVSDAIKEGGKQARDRFIFVVNKFDALDLEKENSETTLSATRKYLAEFGIEQPNIFPISAYASLLIRKSIKNEEMTRKERKDLEQYLFDFGDKDFTQAHFETLASVSPSVKKKIEKRLAEATDPIEISQIHTGVPAIEETINEYLEKYAYPIKVNDAICELKSIIDELDMIRSFNEKVTGSESEYKKICEQVKRARLKQRGGQQILQEFSRKIDSYYIDESHKKSIIKTVEEGIRTSGERVNEAASKSGEENLIESEEAKRILNQFSKDIERVQIHLNDELTREIENSIKAEGNKMKAEYNEIVRKLFNDIQIDNFNFSTVRELQQYQLNDINQLMRSNTSVKDIMETKWVKNTEREGLTGFFKFWRPKEVSYQVKVGEQSLVDVKSIIISETSSASNIFRNNINDAFDKAKSEVENFKNTFKQNLAEVDKKVTDIIEGLAKDMENIGKLKQDILDNRTKLKEIKEISQKINEIMNF